VRNPLREWTVADVGAFLADLRLDEYVAGVAENEVDGHTLLELVAVDGLSDLGVTKLHTIRIKRALEKAAKDIARLTCAPAAADGDPARSNTVMPPATTPTRPHPTTHQHP
jgi:hypothetical protein